MSCKMQGLALWVLHEWRNIPHFGGIAPFIVIVSNTDDQAEDRVMDIRDELEANKSLRTQYGSKVPPTTRRRADDDADGVKSFARRMFRREPSPPSAPTISS